MKRLVQRLGTCVMLFVLFLCVGTISVSAATYTNGFGSDGSYQPAVLRSGYYEISNGGQLYWFAQQVNSGNTSINARLTADITVNEETVNPNSYSENTNYRMWTVIGSSTNKFSGIFDGNGHSISGLYYYCKNYASSRERGNFGGLFYANEGEIRNLTLENSYFYHYDMAASLCHSNSGKITNCTVNSKLGTGTRYNAGVVYRNLEGGIISNCEYRGSYVCNGIASINQGTISNCSNYVSIGNGAGICSSNYGLIEHCKNYGEVAADSYSCGGISVTNLGTITDCLNAGTVTSYYSLYAGGICATNSGTVLRCGNTARVSSTGSYIGGIAGANNGSKLGNILIKDCYNTAAVELQSSTGQYSGGIAGSNGAQIVGCYSTGSCYVTSAPNTGYICGSNEVRNVYTTVNGQKVLAYTYAGSVRNCLHSYSSNYSIGAKDTGCLVSNVHSFGNLYGTPAAYFLNGYTSDGDISWYQNIDNGQPQDFSPVLDDSHGTVYYHSDTRTYSNTAPHTEEGTLPGGYLSVSGSWELDEDGVLTITGTKVPNFVAGSAPWYPYRDQIRRVELADSVTTLGNYAFYNCPNLESVSFGKYFADIGTHAFACCTSLTSIYMPPFSSQSSIGNLAFYGCTALQTASFSPRVTLGSCVFENCTTLKELYLNSYVYSPTLTVGYETFRGVEATLYYPQGMNQPALGSNHSGTITTKAASYGTCGPDVRWSFDADTGTLTLSGSGSPSWYSSGSFTPWNKLIPNITSIVMEAGITELPSYLFEYANKAARVTLPRTLKTLASNAFNDCTSLNNLLIPDSVTSFVEGTSFNRCPALTDLYYLGTRDEWDAVENGQDCVNSQYSGNNIQLHFLTFNSDNLPTCTEPGTEPYYFFENSTVYSSLYGLDKKEIDQPRPLPATGHSEVVLPAVEPTCQNTGLTEGKYCEICGEILTAQDQLDKVPHDMVLKERQEPTCTQDGSITSECRFCGMTDVETLTKLGHNYTHKVTAPTCEEQGCTTHTCAKCGDSYQDTFIPATGHTWKPATLQAPKTCTICGKTEGEPLNGSFSGGSGTASDPYQIENKLQLDNVRNYLTSHFILIDDITFTEEDFAPGGLYYNDGAGWTPIGHVPSSGAMNSFTGSLNGQNHTISGLESHGSGSAYMVGLFSYLGSGAVVKDLTLSGFDVSVSSTGRDAFVGALAGYGSSFAELSNVTVADTTVQGITATYHSVYAGGIIGRAYYNGTTTDCTVTDSVSVSGKSTAGYLYVGGMIAHSHNHVIKGCSSAAVVSAESSAYTVYAGGVVGSVTGTSQTVHSSYSGALTCTTSQSATAYLGGIAGSSEAQVYDCRNSAPISLTALSGSNSHRVGGIVGSATQNCNTGECINTGDVSNAASSGYTGGIAGYHSTNTSGISNCRNEGSISAISHVGGIVGNHAKNDVGDSRNTGRIYSKNGNAGGITANLSDSSSNGKVHGCSNFGEVVSEHGSAAGIAVSLSGTLINCYNAGNVKQVDGKYQAAGISCGKKLSLCYNVGLVTKAGSTSGAAAITPYSYGTTQNNWYFLNNMPSAFADAVNKVGQRTAQQMTQQSTFAGFNFSTVWVFEPLSGYPYPQMSVEMPKLTGIELLTIPVSPIAYIPGAELDLTGVKGIATFEDGSSNTFDVTADLLPDFDPTTGGVQSIPLSYKGFTSSKTLTIDVHVHNWTAGTVTAPTCTAGGYTEYTCTCGASQKDAFTEAAGHSWTPATPQAPKTCTVCGAVEGEALPGGQCGDQVTWSLDPETGAFTVSGTGPMWVWYGEEEVPWHDYREQIKSVTIGDSVTSVGKWAFSICPKLTSVDLGNSITDIGFSAFWGCDQLPALTLPDSLLVIGETAFSSCHGLRSIVIPDSVTTISNSAFWSCWGLESVQFGSGLTTIGASAFIGCKNLVSVTIPASVTKIGSGAFGGAVHKDFVVEEGNTCYKVIDGVLFTADNKTLVACPMKRSGDYVVPDEVVTIGLCAFLDCTDLTSVKIGVNVTSIEQAAFDRCTSLSTVWYAGTMEQWKDIRISLSNEPLTSANIVHVHTSVSTPDTAPTCTAAGQTGGTHCTVCGETLTAPTVIPAKGHTEVTIPKKSATCTETGLTEGKKCSVCGEILVAQEVRPVIPHLATPIFGTPATCTKPGLTAGIKCLFCGTITKEQQVIPAKGHTETILPAVEPTCTQTGLTEGKKCSACEEVFTAQEVIPAKGHTEVIIPENPATCTEFGRSEGKKCSTCNATLLAQKIIFPKGHTEEIVPGKAPTCTELGFSEGKKCSVCGYVIMGQTFIDKLPHTEVTIPGKPATETETGLTEGKKCSVCGTVTVEQQVIPVKDHVHTYTSTVTQPTCTKSGYTTHTCTGCGNSYKNNYIGPKGHTEVTIPSKAATCTESGLSSGKKCSTCGQILIQQIVWPVIPHHTVPITGTPATCTEPGLTGGEKCDVCGTVTVEQQVIPAKGHTEVTIPGKPATETETGLTDGKKCSVCGTVTVEQQVIPVKDHVHNYASTVTQPTCTEQGYTTYSCSGCGHSYQDDFLPAKGHTEVTISGKPATCTETGLTEGKVCSVCGTVTVEQQTIAKRSHMFDSDEARFIWSADYSSATVELPCAFGCGHTVSDSCTYTYTYHREPKKMIFAIQAESDYYCVWDVKTFTISMRSNDILISLPGEMENVIIMAAAYDSNGRMTAIKTAQANKTTLKLALTGDYVKVFFLNADTYIPSLPDLSVY